MLTYSFENIGSDCLYEYLYKCIKNDIIHGNLAPGTKLPSKRSFAKNLNISTITVENAYGQLVSEGYLHAIPKKGYFVADLTNIVKGTPSLSSENIQIAADKTHYFADFTSNQTSPDNFPFSIWAKLTREIMASRSAELMTNSPCGGILELRRAIAEHLKQFRGMTVLPEQIIVGAGTEYLYGLLIQLLGRDRIYAVEDPGYQKVAQIYKSNNVTCHHIPIDENGIQISALEDSHADIMHISPSHHYPTGIITPISRRYELLGWAAKSDSRYIIEDDYDCEFRLMGKPIPSLQSIDVSKKVIYMNTFTKSLASTIRISYMVLPKHLIERYYAELYFYSCTVSNFEQYTLATFLNEGYFEKHINRMRNFYRTLRDMLLEYIKNSPLSSRVSISEEDSGLHFLMYVDTARSDEELIRAAAGRGIRITCLSQYYHGETVADSHAIVMNYSGVDPKTIPEALNRLGQCF